MRTLIFALALLLAASAGEARTLVVRMTPDAPNPTSNAYDQQFQDLAGILNLRGANWTAINHTVARTLFVQTGVQTWGFNGSSGTGTSTFDCVVLQGWDQQALNAAGMSVDSLTLSKSANTPWPSVPVIILIAPHSFANRYANSAACSTVVAADASPISARYPNYDVVAGSRPYKWNSNGFAYPGIWTHGALGGRIVRPLVSLQYAALTCRAERICADCDSTGPQSGANLDTLIAWTIARSASEPAPLIFMDAGANEIHSVPLLAAALAYADSVSGGKVFDNPAVGPIKVALVIHHAVGRGDYRFNGQNTYPASGGVMVSTLNDSANVISSLDSLNSLAVKMTFLADPCSLATYPSSVNWMNRVALARTGLEVTAGVLPPGGAAGANSGNASASYPADPFGRLRSRVILPPNATTAPTACGSDTTSIYCNLSNAVSILKANVGARFDPSIAPGACDWSPISMTKATQGPGVDSVLWAVSAAGFSTLLIEPITTNTNPGIQWDIVNGTGLAVTQPHGYFPDAYSWPIYNQPRAGSVSGPSFGGGVRGRINLVGTRGASDGATTAWLPATHNMRAEFWVGLVSSNWYYGPLPYYYHSFYTRTPVFSVNMSQLGGDGSANPARMGWWQIKWLVNEAQFANSLMPVGKKLFDFVYLSEAQP